MRPTKHRLEEIRKTIEVTMLEGTQYFPLNWLDIKDLLAEIDALEIEIKELLSVIMNIVIKKERGNLKERLAKLRKALKTIQNESCPEKGCSANCGSLAEEALNYENKEK